MSISIAVHANRNFRRRTLSNGDVRGLENYMSFTHGERPTWWNEEHDEVFPDAVGVLENSPGGPKDAIVIRESGLTVLTPDGMEQRFVPILDVTHMGLPIKEPVSRTLTVHLRSGQSCEIPAYTPEGVTFALYRFLLYAKPRS